MKIRNRSHCERCSYFWVSRTDNPIQCPRCKSYSWMQIKKPKGERGQTKDSGRSSIK